MIVIYGNREKLTPVRSQLSDTIHHCMVTVLGLTEGKRAHRFIPLDPADLYSPEGRTEAYTLIEINMIEGRKTETKKSLIKCLFSEIQKNLNMDPIDIEIIIKEQPAHCWGFRGMTGDEAKLNYKIET